MQVKSLSEVAVAHDNVKKDHRECEKQVHEAASHILMNITDSFHKTYTGLDERKIADSIYMKVITKLLDKGANINARSTWGETVLCESVRYGRTELAQFLIDKRAQVDVDFKSACVSLLAVSEQQAIEVVTFLIEKGADLNRRWYNGSTLLSSTIEQGYDKLSKLLIENGADLHEKGKYSPLYQSIACGKIEMVQFLMKKGLSVDPELCNAFAVLLNKAECNHMEMLQLLIDKGMDLNARLSNKGTLLSLAIQKDNKELAAFLIDNGADMNMTLNRDSYLYYSIKKGRVEIAKLLLEKGYEIKASESYTFSEALEKGYKDFLILFVNSCGEQIEQVLGATSINKVIKLDYRNLAQVIIEKGVDLDVEDCDRCTPLHRAAENGASEIVKLLIDKGASLSTYHWDSGTPLHVAAEKGFLEIVQLFIDNGMDINSKERFGGNTPLHVAAEKGHLEIIQLLLDHGADVNGKSNYGNTPLSNAMESKRPDVLRALILKGAEFGESDKRNKNLFDAISLAMRAHKKSARK